MQNLIKYLLIVPAVIVSVVNPRSIFLFRSIIAGKRLPSNSIQPTEEREFLGFLLLQFNLRGFVPMIVADKGTIWLFNSKDIEESSRRVNCECSPIVSSCPVCVAGRLKFDELILVFHTICFSVPKL